MATSNKVRFGLRNVYYAVMTENVSEAGVVTFEYATPVPIPGAVTLTLDSAGESTPFYADDIVYYQTEANNGYEGDLEVAQIPERMMTDVFGMVRGADDNVIVESADAQFKPVALMFKVSGDQNDTDYVLYKVNVGRPGVGSATTTNTKEPQTSSMSISAVPRGDMKIKAHTTTDTPETVKNGWYTAVYDGTPAASADITAFIINGVAGVINGSNITVTLPAETTVTALSPTIALSAGATVAPTSGTAKDFTSPVEYVVTSSDETTTKTYTVTVIVEEA